MNLRVLEEAKDEIRHAAQRYDQEQPGLGTDFLDAVTAARTAVELHPLSFPRLETLRTRREIRFSE